MGEHSLVSVHIIREKDIRGGCCGTETTRGWWRNSVNHVIIDHLKTVGFKVSLIFEIFIEIQFFGMMGLIVLNVSGGYLDRSINFAQQVFSWMRHGGLVVGSSILEFLTELLHLEDHCFGFTGHRNSEEGNGLNDVVDNSFELSSMVK